MNRKMRMGALLLSATMLCSVLGGCTAPAGTEDSEATAETTEATGTTTETTEATETPTVTAPVESFNLDDMTDSTDLYLLASGVAKDTVVATAGGIDVTAGEYLYAASNLCNQILQSYQSLGMTEIPWTQSFTEKETMKDYIAESAIKTAAMYHTIPVVMEDMGLTVDGEKHDAMVDQIDAAKAQFPTDLPSEAIFWQIGATSDLYLDVTSASLCYDTIVEHYLETGIDGYPTQEDMVVYGDAKQNYAAKHILIKTVDETGAPLSDEDKAERLALAEDLLAQLKASSDPITLFDSLMNEYSEDGRDPATGELYSPDGYKTSAGQMVAEFEKAALELEENTFSDLVETTYGYHIIMRLPMDVDYSIYREEMIVTAVQEMQMQWAEDNAPITNEVYDSIDVKAFYDNMTVFKTELNTALQEILAAKE